MADMEKQNGLAEEGESEEIWTITLPGEDGEDQEYEVVDEFTLDGQKYMVVAELDEEDQPSDDYEILAYQEDGEDVIIDSIEDDAEYERISDAYAKFCEEAEAAGAINE